jgi:hypothetical protein
MTTYFYMLPKERVANLLATKSDLMKHVEVREDGSIRCSGGYTVTLTDHVIREHADGAGLVGTRLDTDSDWVPSQLREQLRKAVPDEYLV